jgi:hypothetical protein
MLSGIQAVPQERNITLIYTQAPAVSRIFRAVDHKGEVLESYVAQTHDKSAALAPAGAFSAWF